MLALIAAVFLSGIAPLWAQFEGEFHFVQISIQPGVKAGTFSARNALGILSFKANGELVIKARKGADRGPLHPADSAGRYEFSPESISIADPVHPNGKLRLRFNHERTVLIGTSESAKDPNDLFFAVRGPAPGASPRAAGDYGGVYLSMRNAEPAELSTALIELMVSDARTEATVTGHVAGIDDVVRVDKGEASVSVKDGGKGVLDLKAKSDVLSGEREIAVSADGGFVLGLSKEAGRRDLLLLMRRPSELANRSVRGTYWMAEITGETPFVFAPAALRLSSAFGTMRSGGDGRAHLSQHIRSSGRSIHSTVLNAYLLSGDGTANLGPKSRYGLRNLALSADASVFAGAQTGNANDLVLDHGIFIGVKTQPAAEQGPVIWPSGVGNASTRAPGPQPIAPGSLVSLEGSGLASQPAKAAGPYPQELAGVRVTVNGEAVSLRSVSFDRVEFVAPVTLGSTASIQLASGGKQSNTVIVPAASSSPALVTEEGTGIGQALAFAPDGKPVTLNRPAAEGEVVALVATGIGKATPADLKVLIGGKEAETVSIAPAPDQPAVYHVKVKVPKGSGGPNPVPVALSTPGSFTDLADLPVQAAK